MSVLIMFFRFYLIEYCNITPTINIYIHSQYWKCIVNLHMLQIRISVCVTLLMTVIECLCFKMISEWLLIRVVRSEVDAAVSLMVLTVYGSCQDETVVFWDDLQRKTFDIVTTSENKISPPRHRFHVCLFPPDSVWSCSDSLRFWKQKGKMITFRNN